MLSFRWFYGTPFLDFFCYHGILEWFGWEGTLKIIQCHPLPPSQIAPIPSLGNSRGKWDWIEGGGAWRTPKSQPHPAHPSAPCRDTGSERNLRKSGIAVFGGAGSSTTAKEFGLRMFLVLGISTKWKTRRGKSSCSWSHRQCRRSRSLK